jgi:hypothetical protein
MSKRYFVTVLLLVFLLAACGDDSGITAGNSRYTETDWFFRDDVVREVRITINPEYLTGIVLGVFADADDEKVYALASAVSIDGEILPNVGIRSRATPRSTTSSASSSSPSTARNPTPIRQPTAMPPSPSTTAAVSAGSRSSTCARARTIRPSSGKKSPPT